MPFSEPDPRAALAALHPAQPENPGPDPFAKFLYVTLLRAAGTRSRESSAKASRN